MRFKKFHELNLKGKRVLIRQDLNVPIESCNITSTKRIDASLVTIQTAIEAGAMVLLMSHLGRPKEGHPEKLYSLGPVARYLSNRLGMNVQLVTNYLETAPSLSPGQVVLLENVRFNQGEDTNDQSLSRQYARLCDIFVMDAFATAHRAQASTCGVGEFAPDVCAGPLLSAELEALDKVLDNPQRPVIAIVGGAKVSTKLTLLESLLPMVDQLIPGGGIANTFIAAAGLPVGNSLYTPELVDQAYRLMLLAQKKGGYIPIPSDVVVAQELSPNPLSQIKKVQNVSNSDQILDIGPETVNMYLKMIKSAGTIIWNGPVGVFEFEQFAQGTRKLGAAVGKSNAYSIAGGGETLAAIDRFSLESGISYISTGGGAFLEFLEGKTLPAVRILESRYDDKGNYIR